MPIIVHHNDVNDFALSSEKFKCVMYADDTTLTLTQVRWRHFQLTNYMEIQLHPSILN